MEEKNSTTHQDQATGLKELFNEIQQGEAQQEELEKNEDTDVNLTATHKIDVLNLPPRKEIHSNKKQRVRMRLTKPLIRLMFVTIIIACIVGGMLWGEELLHLLNI